MTVFIIRRLLYIPFVLLGVTLLIVLLLQLLPVQSRAAAFVTSDQQLRNIGAIIEQYGLDRPPHVQYWNWLREAFRGNLGYSPTSRRPVMTTIRQRLPASAELALLSLIPIIGFGVWAGTVSALHRDKLLDQITRVFAILGISLPTFVLGIWLLVIFYGGFGEFLRTFAGGWFRPEPGRISNTFRIQILTGGFTSYTGFYTLDGLLNGRFDIFADALRHLVLPVITLTAVSAAQIMRVMRASLLDVLSQDYVRTARAKGLQPSVVNRKHARRNALIPVITIAAINMIFLINGVVVTETVFNYPGLGQWFAAAATQLDYAAVMGFTVLTALIVVSGNLLADVLYALVDPRIRYD